MAEAVFNPLTFDKATTDWTIMVYIAADGTLANFAVESLKELNRAASELPKKDEANVVVAAQFSIDAPVGLPIDRYIFKNSHGENPTGSNLKAYRADPSKPKTTEREALKDFLEWVYTNSTSNHYALILWSHGPELFLQPPPGKETGDPTSLYLTPENLRETLELNRDLLGRIPDIIGFDACSMSMFEMAYELKGLAKLMVASQEEVPDASLPYYDLVKLFREHGTELGSFLEKLPLAPPSKNVIDDEVKMKDLKRAKEGLQKGLEKGVQDYLNTYQDYIFGKSTRLNHVTLSVLNLTKCDPLREVVSSLADALLNAENKPKLPGLLINARRKSKHYVGGLYVDLHDFCTKLSKQLEGATDEWEFIKRACNHVVNELESQDSLILINGAVTESGAPLINKENRTANHGISIYLPYLPDDDKNDTVKRPLVDVKGGQGTLGGKGGQGTLGGKISEVLNRTVEEYLMSARQNLILTTEKDYAGLQFAKETQWYSFITNLWTKALIQNEPNNPNPDPDFHYSARQSAVNLAGKPINVEKDVSKSEKSA